MRKFFVAILVAFCAFVPAAHADKMVNVEYIHKLIEQRWDITIPYSPKLSTPKVAANMKYLLTLVDMTNKRINGVATTHYGDGEFATMAAADTVAANRAITKLARIKPKFTITTTPDTTEFTFRMSAKGRFMVDWGDNTATQIVRDNTELTPYTHTYRRPGEYKIKMTGRATGYDTGAAISFSDNKNVAGISGSLGAIFSTIGDGSVPGQQPRFSALFYRNYNMASPIPEDLFAGVYGQPVASMFGNAFSGCRGLTSPIPEKLFAGIQGEPTDGIFAYTFNGCANISGAIPEKLFAGLHGAPAAAMFNRTFEGCRSLSGPIPEKLFAGISGKATTYMYSYTFAGCSKLTGPIPAGLFGDIYGAPQHSMFRFVFYNCSGLTGEIPEDLFGNISGPATPDMFKNTFYGCTGLSGPSAKIDGKYLYDIWPAATAGQVGGCYGNASGLVDYDEIPDMWKGE